MIKSPWGHFHTYYWFWVCCYTNLINYKPSQRSIIEHNCPEPLTAVLCEDGARYRHQESCQCIQLIAQVNRGMALCWMEADSVTVGYGASDRWRSKPDPQREQEQEYSLDQRILELVTGKGKKKLGLGFSHGWLSNSSRIAMDRVICYFKWTWDCQVSEPSMCIFHSVHLCSK